MKIEGVPSRAETKLRFFRISIDYPHAVAVFEKSFFLKC